jgi:transposase
MVQVADGNIAGVAKGLGIAESTIGNWVRRAREEAAGAPTAEERGEIRELRREPDRVEREWHLLAKAVAFFSAQSRIG